MKEKAKEALAAVKQRAKAALKTLNEDVARSWPQSKQWPEVGQRVRLTGAHPCAGHTGEVVGMTDISLFPEHGERPLVRLDAGHEVLLMQADQWESR